jgi:large conductance mechanosensitive channel
MKELLDKHLSTGIKGATSFVNEFKEFLLKNNFVGTAVGFVLGVAVGDVVKSIVEDFINPLIGLLAGGKTEFGWHFDVGGQKFLVGHFIGRVIYFGIVGLVVFSATKFFLPKAAPAAPTKECKLCLEAIAPGAKRCKFCGGDQPV